MFAAIRGVIDEVSKYLMVTNDGFFIALYVVVLPRIVLAI
jgi:hypothetical protein